MRNFLLSSVALLALSTPAWACGQAAIYTGDRVYDNCGNLLSYQGCSNCGMAIGSTTVTVNNTTSSSSCCTVTVDDSTLASWAAKKAIENQQSSWWNSKKVKDLSREELDARTEKLTALKVWAKGLSNHIFSTAYCDWADARLSELASRRQSLDQLDVALSLVKGLPTPPGDK